MPNKKTKTKVRKKEHSARGRRSATSESGIDKIRNEFPQVHVIGSRDMEKHFGAPDAANDDPDGNRKDE